MKQFTLGVFASRADAERAINELHQSLRVPKDDISFVYRNDVGQIREVEVDDITDDTPGEGAAKGALVGGVIGAIAGLATFAGVLPIIGPLFAAGPLASALGLTGALGSAAAGGLTGAAAGGLVGALVNLGVSEEHAQQYEDRVRAGNILVAANTDADIDVASTFLKYNAIDVNEYSLASAV